MNKYFHEVNIDGLFWYDGREYVKTNDKSAERTDNNEIETFDRDCVIIPEA